MNIEFVRIDVSLDDILPEPPGCSDKYHVAKPGFGIEREDDTARREVGANHLHHPDRQRHLEVVEAVVDAVDDSAIGEDRGNAASTCVDHLGFAMHVQKAVVLTGEAGGRQVFGSRRAADRDSHARSTFLLECLIGLGDAGAEIRVARRLVDDLSRGGGPLGQQRHVVVVEIRKKPAQFAPSTGAGQHIAVGRSRQCKAVRNPHPLRGECRIELPERRVLAADLGDIPQPEVTEPADVAFCRQRTHSHG